jgi:hypothetical protein
MQEAEIRRIAAVGQTQVKKLGRLHLNRKNLDDICGGTCMSFQWQCKA